MFDTFLQVNNFLMCKKIFALATIAFAALSVPVFGQQQSLNARIAGLSEDVSALRAEVSRLRVELEELRAENARLLELAEKKVDPEDSTSSKIASLRAEMKDLIATQKREIVSDTDAKIKSLAEMTNRALADLSRNVNNATIPGPVQTSKPKDFPDGGIEYTVKPGDTLSKIISRNRSKQNWVLYANPGMNPNRIQVGQKIFVPQKD